MLAVDRRTYDFFAAYGTIEHCRSAGVECLLPYVFMRSTVEYPALFFKEEKGNRSVSV